MNISAYDRYKACSSPLFEKIPDGWEEQRIKFQLKECTAGGTPESNNELYWRESGDGVPWVSISDITNSPHILCTIKDISLEGIRAKGLKIVGRGAVLYSIFASLGKVSEAAVNLVTNQAILALQPKDSLCKDYLKYWLESIEVFLMYFSTSNTQNNLNSEKVGNLPLFMPPKKEQIQIVAFLDHETARIDALIEKQQQLIHLLKEKRQAVIGHAVTKGLNPSAKMRESAVEWLGEIPEHWVHCSLKHYAHVIDCKHITAEFFDDGIPLASIAEVKEWNVNLQSAKLTSEKYYLDLIDGGRKPQPGDIIYSRNATVGEAALVAEGMPNFAMGQDVCLIRLNSDLLPEFILHVLKSPVILQQLDLVMVGSTFKRINVNDIRNFSLALPPVEEQAEIIEKVNRILGKYDALASKAQVTIELMQERRATLISAAVTGKINVRTWVAPQASQIDKEVAA